MKYICIKSVSIGEKDTSPLTTEVFTKDLEYECVNGFLTDNIDVKRSIDKPKFKEHFIHSAGSVDEQEGPRIGLITLALIGIVGLQFMIIHYSVKPVLKPIMAPINDTIYTYYRGEQGYIRFAKPADVDYNSFPEHSELKPIKL